VPSLVIEVAYSQTSKSLLQVAENHIIGTEGAIRTVIGIDRDYWQGLKAFWSKWIVVYDDEDGGTITASPDIYKQVCTHKSACFCLEHATVPLSVTSELDHVSPGSSSIPSKLQRQRTFSELMISFYCRCFETRTAIRFQTYLLISSYQTSSPHSSCPKSRPMLTWKSLCRPKSCAHCSKINQSAMTEYILASEETERSRRLCPRLRKMLRAEKTLVMRQRLLVHNGIEIMFPPTERQQAQRLQYVARLGGEGLITGPLLIECVGLPKNFAVQIEYTSFILPCIQPSGRSRMTQVTHHQHHSAGTPDTTYISQPHRAPSSCMHITPFISGRRVLSMYASDGLRTLALSFNLFFRILACLCV